MTSKIKASSTVRVVETGKELVLLNVETGKIHALNATGGYVWKLLQKNGPLTIQQIQKRVKEHYDASEETIADGILELLNELEKRKLIDRSS